MVYLSVLTPMHVLQLAKYAPFLSTIFFYDPWLTQETFYNLCLYLGEEALDLRSFCYKLRIFNICDDFLWASHENYPVFLDLTYYRSSLFLGSLDRLKYAGDLRHCLKSELTQLYNHLSDGTIICGNMSRDIYVRKVVEQFTKDHHLKLEIRGNFWFIKKQLAIWKKTEDLELLQTFVEFDDTRGCCTTVVLHNKILGPTAGNDRKDGMIE